MHESYVSTRFLKLTLSCWLLLQQLLDLVVAGAERAVHPESLHVVEESPSYAKHHVLEATVEHVGAYSS